MSVVSPPQPLKDNFGHLFTVKSNYWALLCLTIVLLIWNISLANNLSKAHENLANLDSEIDTMRDAWFVGQIGRVESDVLHLIGKKYGMQVLNIDRTVDDVFPGRGVSLRYTLAIDMAGTETQMQQLPSLLEDLRARMHFTGFYPDLAQQFSRGKLIFVDGRATDAPLDRRGVWLVNAQVNHTVEDATHQRIVFYIMAAYTYPILVQ
jgi:hypothetical protein